MAQLMILILDDLSSMPEILQAWERIGVSGATILSSVGSHRARSWLSKVGLDSLEQLFEAREIRRKTLITAIDEELIDQAIAEAERVVGSFGQPNTGLLVVLPIAIVKGLHKRPTNLPKEPLPPSMNPDWNALRNMLVQDADIILNLPPTLIKPDTPLNEVASAMLACPDVHVACVINDEEQLIGLIKLRALADDIFFHILPEEFISEVTDIEHAMSFASKSRIRTAADAMEEPVWVKQGETIKDAFKRLHDNDLPGLPVVNDLYHVIGYINLLELIALCMKGLDETKDPGEIN